MWGASIEKGTQWHPQMSTQDGRGFGNGIGGEEEAVGQEDAAGSATASSNPAALG